MLLGWGGISFKFLCLTLSFRGHELSLHFPIHAASIRAIKHFIPHAFPFFAPCEWSTAGLARLLRQLALFSHRGHEGRVSICLRCSRVNRSEM